MVVVVDDKVVKEVSSWIENERQCVSIATISHRLGLSRNQAMEVLKCIVVQQAAQKDTNDDNDALTTNSYLVDKQQEQTNDGTPIIVFRLKACFSKVPEYDHKGSEMNNLLYALSPYNGEVTEEIVSTAHQRDMVHVQDMLMDNNISTLLGSSSSSDCDVVLNPITMSIITPAKVNQEKYQASIRSGFSLTNNNDADMNDTNAIGNSSNKNSILSSTSFSRGKKKITTAESFFNSKKPASVVSVKAATSQEQMVIDRNVKLESSNTKGQEDEKENLSVSSTIIETSSTNVKSWTTTKSSSRTKSTTTTIATIKDSTKIGNADDFIGDIDDEDDDSACDDDNNNDNRLEHDKQEKKEKVIVQPKQVPMIRNKEHSMKKGTTAKAKAMIEPIVLMDDNNNDNNNEMDTTNSITGAMDAYTIIKKPRLADSSSTSNEMNLSTKRRRKKLVDKTTADEHGYLHVEKVEIWEDISSDEENEQGTGAGSTILTSKLPTSTVSATTSKNSKKESNKGKSNFKQGTLMGFLKKK